VLQDGFHNRPIQLFLRPFLQTFSRFATPY